MRKVSLATDFIWSNNPLEILGSVTSITFGDLACSAIKDHELTTEEVIYHYYPDPILYLTLFWSSTEGLTIMNLCAVQVKALCDDLRVLGKQDFKHLLK